MPGSILLDRTWAPRLAFDASKLSAQLLNQLYNFDIIALESGGASALDAKLQENEKLRGKLYLVRSGDMPHIPDRDAQSLQMKLSRLREFPRVAAAMRAYRAESGGLGDNDDANLGYIFRLLMIAGSMGSTLLVWGNRYELIRAILEAERIRFKEHEANGLRDLVSDRTAFPFDENAVITDRSIRVLTVLDSSSQDRGASENTSGSNEKGTWRGHWRAHKGGLRWVVLIGGAIIGLAMFAIENFGNLESIWETMRPYLTTS